MDYSDEDCPACNGTGKKRKVCKRCEGTGMGSFGSCTYCEGSGYEDCGR